MHDVLAKSLGSSNAINVSRATINGLRELRRPEEIARLRGKSPEEVSTAGMLRAYRERNMKKPEVTEVALMATLRVTQVKSTIGTKPKQRGTIRALGLQAHQPHRRVARPPGDPGHGRPCAAPRRPSKRSTDEGPRSATAPRSPRPRADASAVASRARAARPPAGAPRARARATTSRPGSRVARRRCTAARPKAKGFKNPFRVEYVVVNLDTLESLDAGNEVDPGGPAFARPRGQAGPGEDPRPRRAHQGAHGPRATPSRRVRSPPSRVRVAGSRSSRRRGATAVRRPVGTH